MEQSPSWEPNSFLASQEIPHVLRYPKFQYCIHNSPSLNPILSLINTAHVPRSTSWDPF